LTTRSLAALGATALALLTAVAPAAPAEARSSAGLDSAEQRLLKLMNAERARAGRGPLRANRRLSRSADYHSGDMLRGNFFAHASSNGASFQKRVRRFGRFKRTGENLAFMPRRRGGDVAAAVVRAWMRSAVHRDALLSPVFRRAGLGLRAGRLGSRPVTVVTVDFAASG